MLGIKTSEQVQDSTTFLSLIIRHSQRKGHPAIVIHHHYWTDLSPNYYPERDIAMHSVLPLHCSTSYLFGFCAIVSLLAAGSLSENLLKK